ncbi:MAG: glycine rich domain-containing protein [Clostridia bacterium]
MEDSTFESLMISVYVFIFILATSLTIYLFSSTVEFADKAYEYGDMTTGDSVVETSSAPKYNVITGAELLTYYYNYTSSDKFGDEVKVNPNYIFKNSDGSMLKDIDIKQTYTLIYKSANTGEKPIIEVMKVASEQELESEGPIEIVNKPNDPIISTNPVVESGENVTPKTKVEFIAESSVTHSFLTNSIAKYYWKIEYSKEDGRAPYTIVTEGTIGELLLYKLGDTLEFRKGKNIIYVTAEDALGNKSNTMQKVINVGFKPPIITGIREINNKVANYGNIDIETGYGANLTFIADAVSQNSLGYIQRYEWYVNNTLVQNTASSKLEKIYTPGTYNILVKVFDSIEGTTQREFIFTVNVIPAPIITSNNNIINANKSIAIADPTINLSFTAYLPSKYDIVKYVWNVDGKAYETSTYGALNLNYGLGMHTVTAYGITVSGILSYTRTFTFTVKEDFIPFEKDFAYNGSYESVTLPAGKYIFEVWGAKGGNVNTGGGLGSYCRGQLNTAVSRTFYIYVGGSNGYNGGGSSNLAYSIGGGGTDIRLTPGVWYDTNSLRSRIIVAGGGGGRGGRNVLADCGGNAGVLEGFTGADHYGNPGTGGTQTSGGITPRGYYEATNGSFGMGGSGERASNTSAGAGGGGYYGGGGASSDLTRFNDLDDSGGGGGSSFVSGYAGCNAIDVYGVHTNQSVHFSGLSFINATIIGANNDGYGRAKITRVR